MHLFILAAVLIGLYVLGRRGQAPPEQGIQPGAVPLPTPKGPPSPDAIGWSKSDILILIEEIAHEEQYERPELVRAIVAVESSYNPRAINTGDRPPSVGLMGLKVPTARAYVATVGKEDDLFDPPTNLRAGVRFLRDLERKWLDSYGLDGVIQMYNLGETRFLRNERSPVYLQKVKSRIGPLTQ